MEKIISATIKLSHKQFRAILKKFRRKKIRQRLAKEREQLEILKQQKRESSPSFKEREEEIRRNSELYDQFEERERIRQHKLWLLREQQAQEEFKRKQAKLELERIRHEEERKRILEEFEKQDFVDKQAEEKLKKIKLQKEEALQEALSNLPEAGPWSNPEPPQNFYAEREQCMFFTKTGCCRFGERCSRGHNRPDDSSTILIKGMYSHFSIDQTARDDYDTDIALEYEDKECYQDFKDFYFDVLPEFKKFGKVVQFKVCNNFEPHLRGNVYVQYSRSEEAIEAYKNFNGRFYAGKQITCEFTHVIRWRSAICGLHKRNLCPKGINCNFLHVFRNPNDEYWEANRDLPPRRNYHDLDSSRRREGKYNHRSSEHRHRYESRGDRRESRSDRHESKNDRYESNSDRYDPRNDKYESRSDRFEYRRDRHESRSGRHEYRNDRYESRNERNESRNERNESRSNKYDSRIDNWSSSSSDYDDGYHNRSSRGNEAKKDKSYKDKYRKRTRGSSSRSESDSSLEDSSQKKNSHKRKKQKKKKSKKHKILESTIENNDGSCTD